VGNSGGGVGGGGLGVDGGGVGSAGKGGGISSVGDGGGIGGVGDGDGGVGDDGLGDDGQTLLADDGVESVDGVGGVVDGATGAVGLGQRVGALHDVTAAALVLRLAVSGERVLHVVGVGVLGVGVVVGVNGDGGLGQHGAGGVRGHGGSGDHASAGDGDQGGEGDQLRKRSLEISLTRQIYVVKTNSLRLKKTIIKNYIFIFLMYLKFKWASGNATPTYLCLV
jgi:hypothetical protein